MLNSGKKISHFVRQKKIIITLVLSEKKILNEAKNHNPLLQVKWSVPYWSRISLFNNTILFMNRSDLSFLKTFRES